MNLVLGEMLSKINRAANAIQDTSEPMKTAYESDALKEARAAAGQYLRDILPDLLSGLEVVASIHPFISSKFGVELEHLCFVSITQTYIIIFLSCTFDYYSFPHSIFSQFKAEFHFIA